MKIAKWMMAVAALLVSTACNETKKSDTAADLAQQDEASAAGQTLQTTGDGGKMLVVFFSHAGDNYSVGDVKEGNTKIVADYIAEITGADQLEIVTHKYDGMAYRPLCDLAKEEQQNGELPPFTVKLNGAEERDGEPVDLSQYATVFVGGPVWWGTWPQVMFTFFQTYATALEGKTLIPFTTHEGSGLGRCVDDLEAAFPKSKVTGQFSIYGHDVRTGKERVEKWMKKIGI